MNTLKDRDALLAAWLDDGPHTLPDETRQAIVVGIRTVARRRSGIVWPFPRSGLPTIEPWRLSVALGRAVVVVLVATLALSLYVNRQGGIGALPSPTPSASPTVAASPSVEPPSEAEVTELLNGFLEARVAGEGAQQYLDVLFEEDIPLLYATTSGAPYERAEFEPVRGIEWPYGFTAFKVRLFAGNTVVEQLFFTPHDLALYPDPARAADARLTLGYVPDGFGTDIAPTTEDGQPVARPYTAFDGEVTLHVAHPWVFRYGSTSIQLIPEGVGPTTDGGERNGWDRLALVADPARVGGMDCPTGPGPGPADAEALAESIRSDPDLEVTAPVAVSAEGAEGLMMDVVRAAGASGGVCHGLSGDSTLPGGDSNYVAPGDRMRLYLFDAPEGSSMRILAVVISVPEPLFERAVESAAPVVSVEFHTP